MPPSSGAGAVGKVKTVVTSAEDESILPNQIVGEASSFQNQSAGPPHPGVSRETAKANRKRRLSALAQYDNLLREKWKVCQSPAIIAREIRRENNLTEEQLDRKKIDNRLRYLRRTRPMDFAPPPIGTRAGQPSPAKPGCKLAAAHSHKALRDAGLFHLHEDANQVVLYLARFPATNVSVRQVFPHCIRVSIVQDGIPQIILTKGEAFTGVKPEDYSPYPSNMLFDIPVPGKKLTSDNRLVRTSVVSRKANPDGGKDEKEAHKLDMEYLCTIIPCQEHSTTKAGDVNVAF